jgi:nitrogen fixation protein
VVDEHGNHTVLATGWYREQRPNLPADTRWPE